MCYTTSHLLWLVVLCRDLLWAAAATLTPTVLPRPPPSPAPAPPELRSLWCPPPPPRPPPSPPSWLPRPSTAPAPPTLSAPAPTPSLWTTRSPSHPPPRTLTPWPSPPLQSSLRLRLLIVTEEPSSQCWLQPQISTLPRRPRHLTQLSSSRRPKRLRLQLLSPWSSVQCRQPQLGPWQLTTPTTTTTRVTCPLTRQQSCRATVSAPPSPRRVSTPTEWAATRLSVMTTTPAMFLLTR